MGNVSAATMGTGGTRVCDTRAELRAALDQHRLFA